MMISTKGRYALRMMIDTAQNQAEGFVARAFLHEMDHLDGHLFIDYLTPLKRGAIRKKMMKQTRGTSAEPQHRGRRR